MTRLNKSAEQRLHSENNMWVATVRPDGRPHLTPVWFAWHDDKVYICIDPHSVKARNLARNPRIALALEDGSTPVILEGLARRLDKGDYPPAVVAEFQRKYDWNIITDGQYACVIETTPAKVLQWSGGG